MKTRFINTQSTSINIQMEKNKFRRFLLLGSLIVEDTTLQELVKSSISLSVLSLLT